MLALAGRRLPLGRRRGRRRSAIEPSSARSTCSSAPRASPATRCARWTSPTTEWKRVMRDQRRRRLLRATAPSLRGMVERGYGRIVNVASIAGKEGNPMAAAYSASKAAVIALTKAIGKDVAGTGVLVNCIAPAVIQTPILDGLSQEHVDYMVERIPMGRMGDGRGGRGARSAGSRARSARSRPARRTTSPAAGPPTDAATSGFRADGAEHGAVEGAPFGPRRRRASTPLDAERSSCRSRTSCSRRSTRRRSGAPASPTSAAATRASRRSRSATSTPRLRRRRGRSSS